MDFGILTLIPPILVIVLAMITKRTFEMLMLGAFVCCIMAHGKGCVSAFLNSVQVAMADGDLVWVVLVCILFGGLIQILKESNATAAFSSIAKRLANTQKKSLVITWLLGLILFIDDYLSIMATSNIMLETCDQKKIPREMFAYVLDSTSAPMCVIIPISTWVVYFSVVFDDQPETAYLGDGLAPYLSSLPFIFYAWLCVLIVPLVIFGIIPKIGGMKKAWERVESTGQVYSDFSKRFNTETEVTEVNSKVKPYHFIIPIGLIIAISIITGDILIGVFWALVACAVLLLPTKIMTFTKFADCITEGMKDMVFMAALVFSGGILRSGLTEIGLSDYVIETAKPLMSGSMIPLVTFLLVAILAFVTGSLWALPTVITPIILPLAAAVDASIPLTIGAIMSGSVFGAHACFYVDVTVLSSTYSKIDNMEHCLTQLPYCLIGGILSAIGFLIAGIIMV